MQLPVTECDEPDTLDRLEELAAKERTHYIQLIRDGVKVQSSEALELARKCGVQLPWTSGRS